MTKTAMPAIVKAALEQDLEALKVAHSNSGSLNIRDQDERTALHQCAIDGWSQGMKFLVDHGADLDVQDKAGQTPLHCASSEFHISCAQILLEAGASVDLMDLNGNTPLSDAIFQSRGRSEMVELLCKFGADPDRENNYGVSPRELSKSIANFDVNFFD